MSKVLLVDDEERFRTSLANRLRSRGYDVVDVGNGEDAVKQVRLDSEIEIAILDLKMPGMDGIQTLQEFMRQTKEILYLPAIAYFVGFVSFWKFLHGREKKED